MMAALIPAPEIARATAAPSSAAISILPLEISWYGLIPKNSQISTVSCLIGIFFKSTSSPTPEASAISQSAPKIPPSVTSCIAPTPILAAILASPSTEM